MVHRNKALFEKLAKENNSNIQDMTTEQGINDIRRVEGILIEAFNQYYGHFPKWNKMGGSVVGQHKVLPNNINIVKSFSNPQSYAVNPIVSRSTIRELSENPTYESFESFLHVVRMYIFIFGMDYNDALALTNKFDKFSYFDKIISSNYLDKELIV